jgi:hypothetical protein
MLNARRTERPTGGDDRVEFVCVEPVLGGKHGFGACVEREVADAAEDGPGRAGVSGLKLNSRRLSRRGSCIWVMSLIEEGLSRWGVILSLVWGRYLKLGNH